jgi:hypothetical protein
VVGCQACHDVRGPARPVRFFVYCWIMPNAVRTLVRRAERGCVPGAVPAFVRSQARQILRG